MDEPTEAQLAGYDVNLIYPGDYGVGASLRGWRYAIEHPVEAAEIIVKWQPDNSLEFHTLAMQALIPLVATGRVPIGTIEADRWQRVFGEVSIPEQPGYTMQFVNEK